MPMTVSLDDIDILDVGNTIQLYGAVYSGNGKVYVVPLPDENPKELDGGFQVLAMDSGQFERFLNQTDQMDVRGPGKAILRKSQRQVDQWIAWKVFQRDGYRCRYCGKRAPLTVDHVILWEQGGATVEPNLISACRRCNKVRGNTEYAEWISSDIYRGLSGNLLDVERYQNFRVVQTLDSLKAITAKPRSR